MGVAERRPDIHARVLVVDDDVRVVELVSSALSYDGFEARTADCGRDAVEIAREFPPDVVILDLLLPDVDGLELLRRLRVDDEHLPVLFLSDKHAVQDQIAGMSGGADDYLAKPFSLGELFARLRALLRDPHDGDDGVLRVGDLTLDEGSRTVCRGTEPLTLTETEFVLLRYLMRNAGRVVSKSQILDRVWEYDFDGHANIVELYISYLRKKLDVGGGPLIHTIRGAGYLLQPPD